MIFAQCSECQRGENSNKHGSGSPVKAQASARVDVPTVLFFFSADQGVQHVCKFLCECLDTCTRATDRDLESSSGRRKANAWIRGRQATDRDLASKRCEKVNAWICAPPTTNHDPASVIPDKKRKSMTTFFFLDLMFLELSSPVTCFLFFYLRNDHFFFSGPNVSGIEQSRNMFSVFLLTK